MKKSFLLYAFILISSLSLWAYDITTSAFIYGRTTSTATSNYPSDSIPMGVRRINFKNLTNNVAPELETALSVASGIFTDAMLRDGIDIVPLDVTILMDDIGPDENVICKVEINYADTVSFHPNYPSFSWYETSYDERVLLPMAMINQSQRKSGGTAMRITLRPNVTYHYGIDPAQEGEYDVITILLRALAMGCGIQSTFNPETKTVGYVSGEKVYVNAFDTQIFNEDHVSLVSVADGDVAADAFFSEKGIYAYGYFGPADERQVYLQNEKAIAPLFPYSELTANTIVPDNYTENEIQEDFYDLLESYLPPETSIRVVTPYTMALLRQLGWRYNIPVGPGDGFADLYNCQLICNDSTLSPNTSYSIGLNRSSVLLENAGLHCELQSIDSVYDIGSFSSGYIDGYTFTYSTIPANVQWRRNPISKNIIGQIRGTASMFVDTYKSQTKLCDIEIPYRPNHPLVQRNESASQGNVLMNLSVFANGSNTYTMTYVGWADSISHTETITKDAIDTILVLPATQLYDFTIYGTNSQGNSDSCHFTMGASVIPPLYLNVIVHGSIMQYYLDSNHSQNIPCVNISSVVVTNPQGLIYITSNASPGDEINISSLSRGYYIISVVANGSTYSKIFYKR